MRDGRGGTGVEATVVMAAKHAGDGVFFKDVRLYRLLLWTGGMVEGVFEEGGKGGTRTEVGEDVGLEEGDRVLEAGELLHGVDPAGIAGRGVSGEGEGERGTDWSSRRWRSDSWPLASW